MKIKKKIVLIIIAVLIASTCIPQISFAKESESDFTGRSVIKVTSTEDFDMGDLTELKAVNVGNGALSLDDDAKEGVFTSAIYSVDDFEKMVASWNASMYEGTSVSVAARVLADGVWSGWFSWGEYSMYSKRGSENDSVDEFIPEGNISKAQFRVIINRNSNEVKSPILRQVTFSLKGANIKPSYWDEAITDLPVSNLTKAPGYSQIIRDPAIGGSICSPSTISVMMNSRNPQLNILPEELALSVQDFNYGFGNWAFSVSGAGLYGYEAFAAYINKEILLYELASGRNVGISVSYSNKEGSSYPYLAGAYGSTGGHLITIIGYEYENGIVDDDYLYFYSSDTYSKNDATSFHKYKWSELEKCWSNRLAYIMSLMPEEGADPTGVIRIDAELVQTGNNTYALKNGETYVDMKGFTIAKTSILGHGTLAYTIEGLDVGDLEESSSSVSYPERTKTDANNIFYYNDILSNDMGEIEFDAGDALFKAGVPQGEERGITIYAIANNGYMYRASLKAKSSKSKEAEEDEYDEVMTETNIVFVDLMSGKTGQGIIRDEKGNITLNADSGIYTTDIFVNKWAPEYLMATINAETEGASSVELQVRAVVESAEGKWSDWFSWGKFGSGIMSASASKKDEYLNMSTDILMARGNSDIANMQKIQLRAILQSDSEGNTPKLFGLNFTFKKSPYDKNETVYIGSPNLSELPPSAQIFTVPTSGYSYFGDFAAWRFENMMLMLLNSKGSDLTFEEVALNGYDFSSGWGNWAYTPFKAGLFGHEAYTQFAANTTIIKQTIAAGKAVGLFVNGGSIATTNSSKTRQIVISGYETDESGNINFSYICCSGDENELKEGLVIGKCTEQELQNAIEACGSGNARGLMYVIGDKVRDGSVKRKEAAAKISKVSNEDHAILEEITISLDNEDIALPETFAEDSTSVSGSGVITYILESEKLNSGKLCENKFYYDIKVSAGGKLVIPDMLKKKLAEGDVADLYIIKNNGVTYVSKLISPDKLDELKEEAQKHIESFFEARDEKVKERIKGDIKAIKAEISSALSEKEIHDALDKLDMLDVSSESGPISVKYTISEGAEGKIIIGSGNDFRVKCDGPFEKFVGVRIDGNLLSADDYSAYSGSTIVILKASYLDTVSVGSHEMTLLYTDGNAETHFISEKKEQNTVSTGDTASVYRYALIFILSAAVFYSIYKRTKFSN